MFTLFHQNHETTLFCECYFLLVDKVALFHHNHETTPCCETYFLLVDKIWDKIILPVFLMCLSCLSEKYKVASNHMPNPNQTM